MILIYTALLCEAQTFIEKLKLKKISSTPKIYADDNYIICIGGVAQKNTKNSLNYIFQNYNIDKAINIGIAGCGDTTIKIGELFCTNRVLDKIPHKKLITSNTPVVKNSTRSLKHLELYDMEGRYFEDICSDHLEKENIYIFKIVSDHLQNTKLSKDFVKSLIFNNLNTLLNFV